jgi:hypothetical protein
MTRLDITYLYCLFSLVGQKNSNALFNVIDTKTYNKVQCTKEYRTLQHEKCTLVVQQKQLRISVIVHLRFLL